MNRVSLVLRNVEDSAGLKRLWFPVGVGRMGIAWDLSLGKDGQSHAGLPKDTFQTHSRHLLQAGLEQKTEGTQRLEEPVSKTTVNS